MHLHPCLFIFLLCLGGDPLRAQPPPADPLGENLFAPDLVMRFGPQMGLTEEQRQAIMSEMAKAQPKFEKLRQQLQGEVAALTPLLKKERVDLEAVLAQSDKVQALEGEMRRAHLALLVGLKNRLTPDQQARLQELKKQQAPDNAFAQGLPSGLQAKMQKLQAGAQQWQKDGRDTAPIGMAMQEFEPLMRSGKFKEAEALLDTALKLLEAKAPK